MALNTRMWENFCNYRFLSRKRYEIVNHQQKVIDSQSIGVGSNDLKWPWKVSNEGHDFLTGLHNYVRAVWPRMTEFGVITQTGGEKHICKGVSHLPIPRWRAPTFTKFLRPLPTPKRFVLERPNLVRQHMRSRSVFLGGQPRTPPRERASPIFCELWPTTCSHWVWETTTKFCIGDQTRCEEKNFAVNHECWRAICLRLLTFLFWYCSGWYSEGATVFWT